MDEAEYCDRVGLMADGRLSALDTPEGLKRRFVPGRLVRVKCAARNTVEALRSDEQVLGVETFGAGFHVQVRTNGPSAADLVDRLVRAGQRQARAEEVEATLEDVFLRVVGQNGIRDGR